MDSYFVTKKAEAIIIIIIIIIINSVVVVVAAAAAVSIPALDPLLSPCGRLAEIRSQPASTTALITRPEEERYY